MVIPEKSIGSAMASQMGRHWTDLRFIRLARFTALFSKLVGRISHVVQAGAKQGNCVTGHKCKAMTISPAILSCGFLLRRNLPELPNAQCRATRVFAKDCRNLRVCQWLRLQPTVDRHKILSDGTPLVSECHISN